MDNLDIFYKNKWIDIEDQVTIRKRLLSESLSIYYIELKNDTIKLRFDDTADEITKSFNHAVDIPNTYPRELYNYIVKQIAYLRDCSIDDVTELLFCGLDLEDLAYEEHDSAG